MEDTIAKQVLEDFRIAKTMKAPWEGHFQELKDFIRPDTGDFSSASAPGNRRHDYLFDGTAIDAAEELASGLGSFLTNPTDRFFYLSVITENQFLRHDHEVLRWIDDVTDAIYDMYNIPDVNLFQSLDECYLDVVTFGTGCINQEFNRDERILMFRPFHLGSVWISENHHGRIDTIFREIKWDIRQIEQRFKKLPEKLTRERHNKTKKYTIIHCVKPRTDRDSRKLNPENKAWASVWVCQDTGETLLVSGYDFFPYHVPRWRKLTDEVWGRSPGMKCLPNIKVLNRIEELFLKAGTKMIDPPLVVPDDGFMLPLKTSPGAVNIKYPGPEKIETLYDPRAFSNLPFIKEEQMQRREFIRKAFHNDWLRMEKHNVEMTAYEVQDRRDEKLRLLAPNIGRLQSELIGPMVTLSYMLMYREGLLPEVPGKLEGAAMRIEYTSAATMAQLGVKTVSMDRYIQRLIPLAQLDPTVLDSVNLDEYAQQLAKLQRVPMSIINSPRDIEMIRQQRQQQQQLAQMAQLAEPASKAIKNLADARAQGGV